MHRVCGLWLGPNFRVRPAAGKNFYLRLTVEKMRAFATFNICGHMAEMTAILRLRLTTQIQKLKYINKLQIFEAQIYLVIKQISLLSLTNLFACS